MFFRLRNAVNQAYFKYRTRQIHASPPVPCDPDAGCELHTMLSARDVPLYLVAARSLLRFHPGFAVIVHDDGTLDAGSRSAVERTIPGCRIISAPEADDRARRTLGTGSYLHAWRGLDASWRRLIDTELWSTRPRRIIMDADVIVLRPPDQVIEWSRHGDRPFLIGRSPADSTPPSATAATGRRHMQTIFRENVPQIAKAMSLPARFPQGTTSGFYGCGNELPLDLVERLVRTCVELGIPMKEWGGEQCTVLYLLSAAGAMRLDPDRHFNFDPAEQPRLAGASVVHFFGTHRYYRGLYPHLASSVAAGRDLEAVPA